MSSGGDTLRRAERLASFALRAALPLALFLSVLRLTMTPAYVKASYRTPNFPADRYGFTLDQRERHALTSLDYLLNDEGIEFLGEREFEDGAPLFNARELRHMVDVKQLTQLVLRLWYGSLALVLVLAVLRWRGSGLPALGADIRAGAWAALILMAALAVGLALSFQTIFVGFHRLFFEGDSWLFFYSDTLIRLFPLRFWQQVFVFLALTTTLLAGLMLWLARALTAQASTDGQVGEVGSERE